MRRRWLLSLLVAALQGCASPEPPVTLPVDGPVTFNGHVARLLQRQCQECHRPGEVAPFPLITYGDAYPRRNKMLAMVQKRKMPPWKAASDHDDFLDAPEPLGGRDRAGGPLGGQWCA